MILNSILILSTCLFITTTCLLMFFMIKTTKQIQNIEKNNTKQYNLLLQTLSVLKTKQATNAVTENSEMIYQDLLQDLIPIMAAIDVMPRTTNEHSLWRDIGGILDEYEKNPFVLEKLRRSIKLDSNIAKKVSHYQNRARVFLHHLMTTEPDGILSTTFTDGLLGQSLSFFTQAQTLATEDK